MVAEAGLLTPRAASVVAFAATASAKPVAAQQDRHRVVVGSGGAAAVVCDGVGSLAGSGVVAERCATIAAEHLGEALNVTETVTALADRVATDPRLWDVNPNAAPGASTLLALAADCTGRCGWSLTGNGSIIELTSIPGSSGELVMLEHGMPQTAYRGGRHGLRAWLPRPTTSAIESSAGLLLATPGRDRLLLACTDGVVTPEERRHARSASGATWQAVPPPAARLLTAISRAWPSLDDGVQPAPAFGAAVQTALGDALEAGELEDDATVAGLFVRAADPDRGEPA